MPVESDAHCIGPGPSAESYLNIPRLISAAEIGDVQAIHPGYGFLSENAHFAEVCRDSGFEFIGPSPEAMALLGCGIRSLSMPPSAVGAVKAMVRSVDLPELKAFIDYACSEPEHSIRGQLEKFARDHGVEVLR